MPSKSRPADSGLPPFGADAQQVWLAGLGALTQAQQEGSKAFETLVQDGLTMQRKVQSAAEAKLGEASAKLNQLTQEMSQRATGQWDKLEGLFEERVARALQSLGLDMPTLQQLQTLEARIAALEAQLAASKPRAPSAPGARKTAPPKAAPRKTARKAKGA
jgi:poly(hydroxyalkanoate) granule-associated protein